MSTSSRIRARQILGQRLRRYRVANDQSIEGAAKEFGTYLMKWQRWETGAISIPAELLPRVAKVVRKSVTQLLGVAA